MTDAPAATSRSEPALLIAAAVLAVAAPVAIGGVHPPVQIALSAASMVLLLVYGCLRGARGLRPVPFLAAAAVALGFTALQLLPLPLSLVGLLSSPVHGLRAETSPGASFVPLTVDAPATWLALARAIACTALLVTVGGLVESRRQARWLLGTLAGAGAALSLLALVQHALGVQSILGFYHPRSTPGFGIFGTFVDVNHAAALMTLTALIAAGLAVELRGTARGLAAGAATLCVLGVLMSSSRSGAFGLAAGGFLLVALLGARSIGLARALGAAVIVTMVAAAAALWLNEALRSRVWGHEHLLANQKTRGWVDGLGMAAEYRWTGVGRGAFEAPINAYRRDDEGVRLVYPENFVVQLASEWGVPVSLLVLALALRAARRVAPTVASEATPAVVGAACGVVGVVMHDLGDFSLELPGVAIPTMVALGVVVGRVGAIDRRRSKRGARAEPRLWLPLWGAGAVALVAAVMVSGHTLDADGARLQSNAGHDPARAEALRAAIARHPADDYLELLAAQTTVRSNPSEAMHHINRALRLHPASWQAHRLAARALLALGRPSQAALEYRLALDSGMGFDLHELLLMLAGHVVDAVPQTPPRLVELAHALYEIGHAQEADAAAARAVDLAELRTPLLMTRVQLALDANATTVIEPSARALAREADSVEAFALAARALSRAGASGDANATIEAGLKQHPGNATLMLAGSESRLAGGDVAGARAMVARLGKATLTLAERQAAEELMAKICDRSGDLEGASLARARARLIAKKRQDMTFPGE